MIPINRFAAETRLIFRLAAKPGDLPWTLGNLHWVDFRGRESSSSKTDSSSNQWFPPK